MKHVWRYKLNLSGFPPCDFFTIDNFALAFGGKTNRIIETLYPNKLKQRGRAVSFWEYYTAPLQCFFAYLAKMFEQLLQGFRYLKEFNSGVQRIRGKN